MPGAPGGIGGILARVATRGATASGMPTQRLSRPRGWQISAWMKVPNGLLRGSVRRTTSPMTHPKVYDM